VSSIDGRGVAVAIEWLIASLKRHSRTISVVSSDELLSKNAGDKSDPFLQAKAIV